MMVQGEGHPIQLLVNYWEIRPTAMGARLDELLRLGVSNVSAFVPWQAVESDISHALVRFIQAAAARKMSVSLILSPEVGVHYPNSGLPKDIFKKADNRAYHVESGAIPVALPPNAFVLPSLIASDFNKRYHSFLTRIDSLLADLGKSEPQALESVSLVMTGSFWKYYRSPRLSAERAFASSAGDYSGSAAVAYRQRVEQFFSQIEFANPNPGAANRWKVRAYEDVNRKWFYQHSEDVFRMRSTHFVRRKDQSIPVRQMELFTPEADPGYAYSCFLQMVSGGNADFGRLSSLLDEAATRMSHVGDQKAASYVHWTGVGGFRSLSDAEKQFLILKSLLTVGAKGGGILIDEGEWFSLSQSFRARAEALARSLSQGELTQKDHVLYLAPHLWSSAGVLWDELSATVGNSARLVASVDLIAKERQARLVVVDPSVILTHQTVGKLLAWARAGRVIALARSPLYTESAKSEIDQLLKQGTGINIRLGVSYRVQTNGEGKVVLYDLPEGLSPRQESLSAWQTFLTSVLSLAGIEKPCSVSDSRLKVIPLEKRGGGYGVFILNGLGRAVGGDLLFPTEVAVSDLASAFSSTAGNDRRVSQNASVASSNRFSLEVPSCGVLPIAVDRIETEAKEREAAAVTSELMRTHAHEAAVSELPGYSQNADIEATWS